MSRRRGSPLATSALEVDAWLDRHATSAAARAVQTDEPWVAHRRHRWRWWRRDDVQFPHPHQLDDAGEADAWAARAERYSGELTAHAAFDAMVLSAAVAGVVTSVILLQVPSERTVGLVGLAICATMLLVLRHQLVGVINRQPVWARRAAALRRRADELAAAAPKAPAPQTALPCRRWCCRLQHAPS